MSEHLGTTSLLIVDDDMLLRSVAAKTLRHAGFQVCDTDSGEDSLLKFASGAYDLILLDVMMPGMDGFEVCRRIRGMPRGAEIPILMLTGLDDTESIEKAYQHGATDFITKPINWTLLGHRVQYALRASAAASEMRRYGESLARAQRLAGMGNWQIFADGRMQCSPQLAVIFGAPEAAVESVSAESFLERVEPTDLDRVKVARELLLKHGTPYQMEFQIVRYDQTLRMVFEQAAPIQIDGEQFLGYEGITQDITERVEAQEKIRQLANYDSVTGLPNQQFFAELASLPLQRARRLDTKCAVVHIDIDRFKSVNDAFGRVQGDTVLQVVAERLRQWTRSSDLASVGRISGEQSVLARVGSNAFTLLVTELGGQAQAALVAQRLLNALSQPIDLGAQTIVLTASIGIALFPNDAVDLPTLARCAEQAVYAAKDAGRAQHRFFDEQMNVHATSRLLIEADLRRAIAGDELRLYFQPKVDASNGVMVGAEALVRWQHPERGLVPPAEFIALAEESGLILPLTDWVLECACHTLRIWLDAGLAVVPLSINLAASSLTDMSLVDKLGAVLERYQLTPERLMLEMTETMLIRDIESGVALLEVLRAKGFGLSLDDFGTGYSSLSYLRRFPVHELKIDRSFVTDSAHGGRDAALAVAIIALGREFGMHVVAEGVETQDQSDFLRLHGCPTQQGYLFSRPVPEAAFEKMLRDAAVETLT